MLDSQIVAAIVAGDPDGLAAAYDRYAAPLYAFSHSLLGDQAEAADVVQDTFVIASARLGGLEDPDLLKSWLFAVARNECHRRLRARPGVGFGLGTGGVGTGEVSDDTADFGIDLERAQLTEVVGAAMAALPLATREVIELSLRQDFDGDDLGSTLGIPPNQAQVLASHARGQFEESVAALLVARSGGRLHCAEVDELLDIQGDRLTAAACQQIVRHVQHCRICSKRMRRDLKPAMLRVLPATEIARGLRSQVLNVVASDAPDVVAYRADVVRGAEPFDEASGFPVPMDQPRRERRSRPAVLALVAAAVFAAICAVALEFGLHHPHRQQQLTAAPVGGQSASPQAQAAASSSSSQAHGQHSSTPGPPGSLIAATPGTTSSTSVSLAPPPGIIRPLGSRSPSTPPAVPPSSRPPTTPATTPPTTPATTPPTTPATTPPTTPATTPPTTPATTPPTSAPPTTPATTPPPPG